jgi:hypothetical protein
MAAAAQPGNGSAWQTRPNTQLLKLPAILRNGRLTWWN